jgi:hypothetical protein
MAYGHAMDILAEMRNYVKVSRYGDDSLLSVQTNGPFDYITQSFLTKAFARIGMVYTDESKTVGVVAQDRRLVDCTFLKRGFIRSHYCLPKRWMANLSLDTILEFIQWTKDHDLGWEFWRTNVVTQLMELSAHPKPVYDLWSKRIQKACVESGLYVDVNIDRYREKQDTFIKSEYQY